MLPRIHRLDTPLRMEAIGQWIVDGLNLGILYQALVVAMDTYIGSKSIEPPHTLRIAAADSHQPSIYRFVNCGRYMLDANISGTEHTPTYRDMRGSLTGLHAIFTLLKKEMPEAWRRLI